MKILGIDPGLALLGWSVIETSPGRDIPALQAYGCLRTEAGVPLTRRLIKIYDELKTLFSKFQPEAVSLETLFFVKNAKTLAQVGHTRGVILLVCGQHQVDVFEYAPKQIKLALTGYGGADKRQIQNVLQRILQLKEIPKPDDAADAVAVALCHAQYSPVMERKCATV